MPARRVRSRRARRRHACGARPPDPRRRGGDRATVAVAASLLFEYIAQYMYDGDAPLAERRAHALSLDRDLLAELLGSDDLRELLDADAIGALELELQRLDSRTPPRDPDEALDILRAIGDLSASEVAARGVTAEWVDELVA